MSDLIEGIKNRAVNAGMSLLTGEPIPGSREARELEKQKLTDQINIKKLKATLAAPVPEPIRPRTPEEDAALKIQTQRSLSQLNLEDQQKLISEILPGFAGIRDTIRRNDQAVVESDKQGDFRREQAGKDSDIDRQIRAWSAATGLQKDLFRPLQDTTMALADKDMEIMRSVMANDAANYDKALAANKLPTVLGLGGALGLAALAMAA